MESIINNPLNNPNLSFEKNLWGRYSNLHDRLQKKIAYLSSVLNNFTDVQKVKREYYKKVKPLLKDGNNLQKSGENEFQNVVSIVNNNNEKFIEYEDEMYRDIIQCIKDLVDKMKKEKGYYDDFIKNLMSYNDQKKNMEKLKKTYHDSTLHAERTTIDLKEFEIKKKINDTEVINKQIKQLEGISTSCLVIAAKDCKNYVASLDAVNKFRVKLNNQQKELLNMYQILEREDGELYSKVINIINNNRKKILELTNGDIQGTESILSNINVDRDLEALVQKLKKGHYPEEEIKYEHYPTEIDFDKSNDVRDYKVYNETVKTMKSYMGKDIFKDYDESLEEKKNRVRELVTKYFDLNKTTDDKDKEELLQYIKDPRTHKLFLITLSKSRTNNRFCREKPVIELLADILKIILNDAEKSKNYEIAKNCIILSQTFFYLKDKELGSNEENKVYIIEYIRNNKWLTSEDYWTNFCLINLRSEFKKLDNIHSDIGLNIEKDKNINDNIKKKISEVMFSQLLPFVNNMQEFGVKSNIIVKIMDNILKRYNYLNEENAETIFGIINPEPSEIEKIRAENNDNNNNNIINNNDKEPPDEVTKLDSTPLSKKNNNDEKK